MIQQKIIWNDAARSGLVLGGVSIGYMVCTILLGKLQGGAAVGVLVNVLSLLLWVFKFVLCIRLMKMFMQKFAASNSEATNGDTFRFGTATALLSALIYSAFYLAWVSFIDPEMLTSSLDMVRETYSNTFTADQMDAFDELIPKLPTITFFANLAWCWLFGTVLSAIFSANIPPRNPFRDVPKDI
jgi:hypothetical protein